MSRIKYKLKNMIKEKFICVVKHFWLQKKLLVSKWEGQIRQYASLILCSRFFSLEAHENDH